jgi:hypothetical protein
MDDFLCVSKSKQKSKKTLKNGPRRDQSYNV